MWKKLSTSVLLLFILGICCFHTVTAAPGVLTNVSSGYNGLAWGDPPPQDNFSLLGKDMGDTFYSKLNSTKVIAPNGEEIIACQIHYVFNSRQFYQVTILMNPGSASWYYKTLCEVYGQPRTSGTKSRSHTYWKCGEATIVQDSAGNFTIYRIFNTAMRDAVVAREGGYTSDIEFP